MLCLLFIIIEIINLMRFYAGFTTSRNGIGVKGVRQNQIWTERTQSFTHGYTLLVAYFLVFLRLISPRIYAERSRIYSSLSWRD